MDYLEVYKYDRKYILKLTLSNKQQVLQTSRFDIHDIEHLYHKKFFTEKDEIYIKQQHPVIFRSSVGKRKLYIEHTLPHIDIKAWYDFISSTYKNKNFTVKFHFNLSTLICTY